MKESKSFALPLGYSPMSYAFSLYKIENEKARTFLIFFNFVNCKSGFTLLTYFFSNVIAQQLML